MEKQKQKDYTIRYDRAEINYITQFLVSPGNEEVLLELSPGLLNDSSDPKTGAIQTKTLPIQTRVALPWSSVERLANVLNQVVVARRQQIEEKLKSHLTQPTARADHPSNIQPSRGVPEATLPQMSSTNH